MQCKYTDGRRSRSRQQEPEPALDPKSVYWDDDDLVNAVSPDLPRGVRMSCGGCGGFIDIMTNTGGHGMFKPFRLPRPDTTFGEASERLREMAHEVMEEHGWDPDNRAEFGLF